MKKKLAKKIFMGSTLCSDSVVCHNLGNILGKIIPFIFKICKLTKVCIFFGQVSANQYYFLFDNKNEMIIDIYKISGVYIKFFVF